MSAETEDLPTICAYCEKEGKYTHIRGPDPGPDYRKDPVLRRKVSHGICQICFDKVMATMESVSSPQRRKLLREMDERLRELARRARTDQQAAVAYVGELLRTGALTEDDIRLGALLGVPAAHQYCLLTYEQNISPISVTINIGTILERINSIDPRALLRLRQPLLDLFRNLIQTSGLENRVQHLGLTPEQIQAVLNDIRAVMSGTGGITMYETFRDAQRRVANYAHQGAIPLEARQAMDALDQLDVINLVAQKGYLERPSSLKNWSNKVLGSIHSIMMGYSRDNGRDAAINFIRNNLLPPELLQLIEFES